MTIPPSDEEAAEGECFPPAMATSSPFSRAKASYGQSVSWSGRTAAATSSELFTRTTIAAFLSEFTAQRLRLFS
jgi:hypothetical protein